MHFNLADLFESVVDTLPDREGLVCADRRLTYRELDRRANQLAHCLAQRGVGPGDHIGLYLYNGTEYIEGMLAAYKIRAVPINVNYRYVEEELEYLFDDADLVALIHHREFAPRIASVAAKLPQLTTFLAVEDGSGEAFESIDATDYEASLAAASPERDFAERSPDDLYIIYTGGTTGMPKGVMWRQEDIFFGALGGGNIIGANIERPEELREIVANAPMISTLAIAPLMHGAAQWSCFIGFFGGNRIILSPQRRFDAAELWNLIAKERITSVSIVGDAMGRPLAESLADAKQNLDLSCLKVIGSGGAIFSQPVKAVFKREIPDIMLFDGFGASETGHQGTGVADAEREGSPIFRMGENNQVFDDENQPVVPGSGVQGRLALRGHIPLGYYNDEAKTAKTFIEVEGVRWVLPGDIATIEKDGTITVFGRGSVSINSGGEKIFPEEVEAALKSHPAVFDALVVGVPDERFGQRVSAVVQPRPDMTLTLDDLAAHARTKVAGYKVPRELHLVDLVVRSPSGKPDYRWAASVAKGSV